MKMSDKNVSKFISMILRHKPEAIGITLDEHGWADVSELITGVNKTDPLTMEDLERIVDEDEKQRYSFNENKTLIRDTLFPLMWSLNRWNLRNSFIMEQRQNMKSRLTAKV